MGMNGAQCQHFPNWLVLEVTWSSASVTLLCRPSRWLGLDSSTRTYVKDSSRKFTSQISDELMA